MNRLSHLDLNSIDLNHAPFATFFHSIADEATPKAKAILVRADQTADEAGLDDEGLRGCWVG
jgi:hypothetical protein